MKMWKEKILDLKPTQFAVGMLEVDEKIATVRKFSKKKRRAFLAETPVPVVCSPKGILYVIDHHHFLCVCYHVGIKKVYVNVVHDLSKKKISYRNFWKWMTKNRSAYPYCQFGEGPRDPVYLPRDIRGLADDPYRSLAWYVRKAGGFSNSDRNFAEFKWANFFRSRRLLQLEGVDGMPDALLKASKLAQSPAAKALPGFGKLKLDEQKAVVDKTKKEVSNLKKRSRR
jgi:hypothetical protein